MPLADVRRRAWLVLRAEQLLARLWPLAFVLVAAVLIALSGLPMALPVGLHLLLLAGGSAALVLWAWRQVRDLPSPSPAETERRVEAASGLRHQPYAALADQPALGAEDPEASRLWQLHREQALIALTQPQRSGWPHLPAPLRQSLTLLMSVLTAALVWTGPQSGSRLAAALSPEIRIPGITVAPPVTAWLEPPAYTGLPTLSIVPDAPARIPSGTMLRITVRNSVLTPRLRSVAGVARALERVDGAGKRFGLSLPLTASGTYRLTTGLVTAARWPITVVPDAAPHVTLATAPQPEEDGTLRLTYRAGDDYGVVQLWAVFRPAVPSDNTPTAAGQLRAPVLEIPAEPRQPEVAGSAFLDLTEHPWAGTSVHLQLEAIDATGQSSLTAVAVLTLPERTFTHPAARQLAALRKQLLQDFSAAADPAAAHLAELLGAPADLGDDVTSYLALRSAWVRLQQAAGEQLVPPSIPPLLWQTALRLESATPEGADSRLRQAEEALRQALANPGSTPEALQEAFSALQTALQEYLSRLQERAGFLQAETAQPLTEGATRSLQDMLQTLMQMAMSGDREQARQALDELQKITDALRQAQQNPERMQALQALAELAGDQAALAEALAGAGANDPDRHRQQQEALAQRLQALQEKLGDLGLPRPPSLEGAGEAMSQAARALKAGQHETGTRQAVAAADLLAGGMDQMMQSLQQGGARFLSLGQPGGGTGRATTQGPRVPNDPRSRLQQILDTLRTRANDPARPADEREYLRRLLDVF